MQWLVVAPFPSERDDPWLGRFVPPGRHRFQSVPPSYVHDRSRKATSARQWLDYLKHAGQAERLVRASGPRTGLITNFPQLPLALGSLTKLKRTHIPTVAWSFNIGALPEGFKKVIARVALTDIDKFVVHSRAEITACSEWLGLPKERFEFAPLQRPITDITLLEDEQSPFIVSMGSAGRDYASLFKVLLELPYRTIVVAGKHAVDGLKIPTNVELKSGLTLRECHELLQRARFSVTPIANTKTASGQVTLVDAMNYGKAQIVTRCPGSVDYVDHGKEALLVEPGDTNTLKESIQSLWEQAVLRKRLGENGRARMINDYSDEAGGKRLGMLLDTIEDTLTK
jgi:glycosyltransferase involved in cell wall biosynthesis